MCGFLVLLSMAHFNLISLVWLVEGTVQEIPQSPKEDLANEFFKKIMYSEKYKEPTCAQCIAKRKCIEEKMNTFPSM